jgi:hypothetical protein
MSLRGPPGGSLIYKVYADGTLAYTQTVTTSDGVSGVTPGAGFTPDSRQSPPVERELSPLVAAASLRQRIDAVGFVEILEHSATEYRAD